MKVRILSGNLAGQIVEQTPDEAGNNIAMGFAELVKDEPEPAEKPAEGVTPPPVEDEPIEEPEPVEDEPAEVEPHTKPKAKPPARKVKK